MDRHSGLRCDQTIELERYYSKGLPRAAAARPLQRPLDGKTLVFLTNNFVFAGAGPSSDLYRCRGQVELFFKWIKQHLRIKAFFGTSENAVKTQVWIAVSVYVLVAIVGCPLLTIARARRRIPGAKIEGCVARRVARAILLTL